VSDIQDYVDMTGWKARKVWDRKFRMIVKWIPLLVHQWFMFCGSLCSKSWTLERESRLIL